MQLRRVWAQNSASQPWLLSDNVPRLIIQYCPATLPKVSTYEPEAPIALFYFPQVGRTISFTKQAQEDFLVAMAGLANKLYATDVQVFDVKQQMIE